MGTLVVNGLKVAEPKRSKNGQNELKRSKNVNKKDNKSGYSLIIQKQTFRSRIISALIK